MTRNDSGDLLIRVGCLVALIASAPTVIYNFAGGENGEVTVLRATSILVAGAFVLVSVGGLIRRDVLNWWNGIVVSSAFSIVAFVIAAGVAPEAR
jgi:hypothetical protein